MSNFILNSIQWPAMLATLFSTWLVTSKSKRVRLLGFIVFIISNILWIIWGIHKAAFAVVVMQIGLIFLNFIGTIKNE